MCSVFEMGITMTIRIILGNEQNKVQSPANNKFCVCAGMPVSSLVWICQESLRPKWRHLESLSKGCPSILPAQYPWVAGFSIFQIPRTKPHLTNLVSRLFSDQSLWSKFGICWLTRTGSLAHPRNHRSGGQPHLNFRNGSGPYPCWVLSLVP